MGCKKSTFSKVRLCINYLLHIFVQVSLEETNVKLIKVAFNVWIALMYLDMYIKCFEKIRFALYKS